MMDIDVFDIAEIPVSKLRNNWPPAKQKMFNQVEVLTSRILHKGIDITGNFGQDFSTVYFVYGLFGEDGRKLFHKVCKLSVEYTKELCEDKFQWAARNSKTKSLRKFIKLLDFYDVPTEMEGDDSEAMEAIAGLLPEDVDPLFVLENGYYPLLNGGKSGYYFKTGEKSFVQQTNFVITPLVHIVSKSDNKRIIRIENGFKSVTLDIPSRHMISLDQFAGTVVEEGNFLFYGSKIHLMKIMTNIMGEFPSAHELRILGWQPEGFFAWCNAIYKPGHEVIQDFNDIGLAEIGENNYFSPSVSSIYSGQRGDDDDYKNDRYLRHLPTDLTFSKWSELLLKVYGDDAIIAIAFVMIGMLKEVVYGIDNNCPHLSAYGQKGSGKSKFAESISAIFTHDMAPFNLFHGTDFAFSKRIERFRNIVVWLDEFDDNTMKEDRFQAIKAAYDGAGRERGKGTNKNKTEIARVNSALLLTGQYLSTRDDNAALTRCLIVPFMPINNRSEESIKYYELLKGYERKGITGILFELLQHWSFFAKEYPKYFPESFQQLRIAVQEKTAQFTERVLRNYTAAYTCLRMLSEQIGLPFSLDEAKARCVADVIKYSTLISESDSLADFWNTILYLLDMGEIREGFHFRIIHTDRIKIQSADVDIDKTFKPGTKLLLLRLTTVHKLYLEAFRKQTGKTGINLQSLELYLQSANGYVGKSRSQRFTDPLGKSMTTSCYVLLHDELNISLDRITEAPAENELTEITGSLHGSIEHIETNGKYTLRYRVATTYYKILNGSNVRVDEVTNMVDHNPTNHDLLLSGEILTFKGILKVQTWTDSSGESKQKRAMDVKIVEKINKGHNYAHPISQENPF